MTSSTPLPHIQSQPPRIAWFWGDNTIKEHLLWPKWDVRNSWLGLACDFCGCTLRQKNGVIWAAFRERGTMNQNPPAAQKDECAAGSSKEQKSFQENRALCHIDIYIGAGLVGRVFVTLECAHSLQPQGNCLWNLQTAADAPLNPENRLYKLIPWSVLAIEKSINYQQNLCLR